jgi:hypothetical protein
MVVLRHPRGVVAAAAVVAFNLLMFVLGAMAQARWRLLSWLHGSRANAALSVAALFLTERP